MGIQLKMKFIKCLILFTCFAVVLLSSSSKVKSSGEPSRYPFNKAVFDTNTVKKCAYFELGYYWNSKIAHFRCKNANREWVKLEIDMNSFIGNSGGKMVRGHGYYASCKDYYMDRYGKKKGYFLENVKMEKIVILLQVLILGISWYGKEINYLLKNKYYFIFAKI